jgi:hypothetical protein
VALGVALAGSALFWWLRGRREARDDEPGAGDDTADGDPDGGAADGDPDEESPEAAEPVPETGAGERRVTGDSRADGATAGEAPVE